MTQKEALDILKLGHNVFLTGSAGSGKTYLLNDYISYLKKNDVSVAVTASTGIAATHLGGQTIHSWSGLGIKDSLSDMELEALEEKRYLWSRFQETKVLIIDEVSMLHHYRLDMIERICRFFKRNEYPFGGLQVILCGDFFQLPPIERGSQNSETNFAYKSAAWKNMNLKICYLEEQFRQKDDALLQILNGIRSRRVLPEILAHLRSRSMKEPEGNLKNIRPTKLFTHNIDVDSINEAELEKLEGDYHSFDMNDRGRPHIVEVLKKTCLAPQVLKLKIGAQVMFVKNNFENGYVNGTLGRVIAFDNQGLPIVETVNGKRITAEAVDWQIAEEGKVLAEISQIPLRLAWAITVHKSQGMSLDSIEVDLSKSFEKGMGYVALSRVRTLNGLKLLGLNDMALVVHPEVSKFDEILTSESQKIASVLSRLPKGELSLRQKKFLEAMTPTKKEKLKKIPNHHKTKALLEEKKTLKEIAEALGFTVETIINHIETLQEEGVELDIGYIKDDAFTDSRFNKISEAFAKSFEKNGDHRLAPVKNKLGAGFSYADIRLARLFLEKSHE